MTENSAVNTPKYTPLSPEEGYNPESPTLDSGSDRDPVTEIPSGRHVDPDLKPDAYREEVAPVEHHVEPSVEQKETHDTEHHVVGESLTEHKPGESFKEWMAADVQQTKEDLHIGTKKN